MSILFLSISFFFLGVMTSPLNAEEAPAQEAPTIQEAKSDQPEEKKSETKAEAPKTEQQDSALKEAKPAVEKPTDATKPVVEIKTPGPRVYDPTPPQPKPSWEPHVRKADQSVQEYVDELVKDVIKQNKPADGAVK